MKFIRSSKKIKEKKQKFLKTMNISSLSASRQKKILTLSTKEKKLLKKMIDISVYPLCTPMWQDIQLCIIKSRS